MGSCEVGQTALGGGGGAITLESGSDFYQMVHVAQGHLRHELRGGGWGHLLGGR